jgi:hypothetical protein
MYSPIFINKFPNQKLKIPSNFDSKLHIIDFYNKLFCYDFKI